MPDDDERNVDGDDAGEDPAETVSEGGPDHDRGDPVDDWIFEGNVADPSEDVFADADAGIDATLDPDGSTGSVEDPLSARRAAGSADAAEAFEGAKASGAETTSAAPAPTAASVPGIDELDPGRHAAELRSGYGRLRSFFKRRESRFADYRRTLNQARIPITYDIYLASVVRRGGLATLVGLLLGAAMGILGVALGLWGAVAVVPIALAVGVPTGAGTAGVLYYRPSWIARKRRAKIDRTLPHGVAYLYALSHGGLDVVEALRALAESETEYGELSREFESALTEMEYLGADPLGALRTLRDRTPSPALASFLDDLSSTMESGGDETRFLAARTDEQFERARRQQDAFLEQVSLYAELYVGVLVVGPIFAVIVLLIVAVSGGGSILALAAVVYVGVPLATAGFLWSAISLTEGMGHESEAPTGRQADPELPDALADDPRFEAYRSERSEGRIEGVFSAPWEWVRARPLRSVLVTGPVAVLAVATLVLFDVATPTMDALRAEPLETTTLLAVLPALIVAVPLSLVHEVATIRERAIASRFPGVLGQLSGANEQGLTLSEGLIVVAGRTGGPLGEELRQTANDVHWGADLTEAFGRLRDRIGIGSVSRTVALLTDASRHTGDLHSVIDVAARDTSNAQRLEEERRAETGTYVAIVAISFSLYLLMLLVLDVAFLERIANVPQATLPEGVERATFVTEIDRGLYRAVLLHAALIQGVCAGLVAGELGEESWLSGLKYAIVMMGVTILAFVVILWGGIA